MESEAIRGQLDSIILRSLLDKDEYGFEILNNIKLLDNVLGEIKQSTFYNALKRLETAELITSYSGDISKGAKRVYYSLTDKGRAFLADEYRRWNIDETLAGSIFGDDYDVDDNDYPTRTRRKRRTASVKTEEIAKNAEMIAADEQPYNAQPQYDAYKHTTNEDINTINNTENSADTYKSEALEGANAQNVRYTSEININTIIAGKIPPKAQPKPTITPDVRSAYDVLYSSESATDDAPDIGAFELIAEHDDNEAIEQKQARLNSLLNMEFKEEKAEAAIAPAAVAEAISDIEPPVSDTPSIIKRETENLLDQPYTNEYAIKQETKEAENINYIDTFSDIYSKNAEAEETAAKRPEVTRVTALNYDDFDEERFKETNLDKLKQRLALENIKLKRYVKSDTTAFYIGKYYYSNKLLKDASLITYAIFLIACIAGHFIAAAFHQANNTLTITASVLGALYPIYGLIAYYSMPAKRKRLPLNLSIMMIASLLIYVISVVVIVLTAFFGVKVDSTNPVSMVVPLILPIAIGLILPVAVVIYGVLFRTTRYNLK